MPYIAIKSYPKDEETRKRFVDKVYEDMKEILGVPDKAITISYEIIEPEKWQESVVKKEVEPRMDSVMVLSGEKRY